MSAADAGPEETRVLKAFADREWEAVGLEQRGPDGTEILAMLFFWSCPLCAAVVPPEARPEQRDVFNRDYRREHLNEHVLAARAVDQAGPVR